MKNTTHPALMGSLNSPAPSNAVINFSPGPTSLPKEVEHNIAKIFNSSGLTTLALSHRSPEFVEILDHAVAMVRQVMEIPNNYEVLFTHAGGHGQFAALPLNLCKELTDKATYVVSGTWSERATEEAQKYCQVDIIDNKDSKTGKYTDFPTLTEEKIDTNSKFIYLCSNETVNGIELHELPSLPNSRKHIPLIVDASSDFSTKPIDWNGSGIGVLFACASKNIGHPGLTITIIRNDLLGKGKASPLCPGVFNYTTNSDAGNLWNTPATFNIEVVGLLMDWLEKQGGIKENEKRSIKKADLIYQVIDQSKGFYKTPINKPSIRSRMNVPFNICNGDEALTNQFLIESWEKGMVGLRTLTPFGTGDYLRASLYNGVTIEDAQTLASFMIDFSIRNKV